MVSGEVGRGLVTIACVLRSGGDYDGEYVARLAAGVARFCTIPHRFLCLSDCDVPCERVPLRYDWPRWWPKLELFSPTIEGDIFYLDLDSIPVGNFDQMAGFGRLGIMRDVYRPHGLQSAIMYIPQAEKARVWSEFMTDPYETMQHYRRGGDQAFLESLWLNSATRFQDTLPGQIVSYKKDVQPRRSVPSGARIVAFHGRPRPRQVGWLE